MAHLRLKRAIVFFDLETTGIDPATDRIVEISVLRVEPDGSRASRTRRINPGRPIPREATAIHGIRDEDVRDEPDFRQVGRGLLDFLQDADLAGFNVFVDEPARIERKLIAKCSGWRLWQASDPDLDIVDGPSRCVSNHRSGKSICQAGGEAAIRNNRDPAVSCRRVEIELALHNSRVAPEVEIVATRTNRARSQIEPKPVGDGGNHCLVVFHHPIDGHRVGNIED